MKICLRGHSYQYAVEQMLLNLFPEERPVCTQTPPQAGETGVVAALTHAGGEARAAVTLCYAGKTYYGARHCAAAELTDKLCTDRALQRILKLALYDAAVQALGAEPPWGALTGVRPVKIPARALAAGQSPAEAEAILRDLYHVSPARRALAMDCARASAAAQKSLQPDEISLYVGIPFCPTRCAYCSFVSADVQRSLKLVAPFLAALQLEIAAAGAMLRRAGLFVRTLYVGGGTPTTLSAAQLDALLGALAEQIDLSRCTEYTVEAGRPDTITAEKLAVLRRNGVDRVSVNPQSMDDAVLAAMGRAHTAADIETACALVRDAGFPCVNMDLIAGLPKDSPVGFRRSLARVQALHPENITVHTLALKKGSRLMGDGSTPPPLLPTAADVAGMLDDASAAMRGAGQTPYYLYRQKYMSGSFENVGWCAPGRENLYNICMMEELHSILALGGGGITKLVNPQTGAITRISNPKYPQEYLANAPKLRLEKDRVAQFYAAMRKEKDNVLSATGD